MSEYSRESDDDEAKNNGGMHEDEEEEFYHFRRVLGSFLGYEKMCLAEAERTRRAASLLTSSELALLPAGAMEKKVKGIESAARRNGEFLSLVVSNQGNFGPFHNCEQEENNLILNHRRAMPSEADFSKVRSTLHSLVRDWSAEGATERQQCYEPLLIELGRRFPKAGSQVRVLVPGAGLGRLALEIAARGYSAQGNEFSYHMLLVSNFILNGGATESESIEIQPFIDQPSNLRQAADRLRILRIPDVAPSSLLGPALNSNRPPPDFSMAAGEFLSVYQDQHDAWSAVVSCFFIDTAPNILQYIDAIYRLLQPGGTWINLGPLLYHWVPNEICLIPENHDDRYNQSIEIAYDELKHAILKRGFSIEREQWTHCNYTSNPSSMMRTNYDCILFTAIKPVAS
mmetsp:Transcript_5721/g.8130  ORF Transcript_5721/g.8130 Transcript_5721/m.8130 type:complete len:400 (-) Transcript_5721:1132-2331(-)|eukprot:CAMPEP_0197290130 /NCGR_PEP_ID=MMETSP0890-20130614/7377_1 /TAXON_ID=44058 ORGANISM="Aureoumbra lagunensis, Strain CCMP1510" /NCGR_SAMPLE_ID=MMETSP0890 /ASSEMBLY_ACC=CAM_ASM_000533 /LENGTH=399 /DNA_ID=CAMNT_0042761969 /DNA_START=92 /DNA_END=1291 /DNA_ORIENTATION=+